MRRIIQLTRSAWPWPALLPTAPLLHQPKRTSRSLSRALSRMKPETKLHGGPLTGSTRLVMYSCYPVQAASSARCCRRSQHLQHLHQHLSRAVRGALAQQRACEAHMASDT
jgi:hypothetical protein